MQEIYAIKKICKNKIEVLLKMRHMYCFLFVLFEKLNKKE